MYIQENFIALFDKNIPLVFLTPGIKSSEEGWRPLRQTFKQRQFSKEEFYYLNVTRVGMFTSNDMFDCTFECVRNTLCLSINMAASRGADGKLWCELLSSDKNRADAENYSQNMSSHHLFIRVRNILILKQYVSHSHQHINR